MLLARLLLFLVAATGHTVFWVAIVNRTHAYGWNRKLVDLLMLACILFSAFGLWPLAQFAAGPYYPSGVPQLPQWMADAWGYAALLLTAVAFAHNTWRYFHRERRGGVVSRRVSPLEIIAGEPTDLLAPGIPRLLGGLPGNQIVSPIRVELELAVPDLPARFKGLKIAHLTDLHMSGRIVRDFYDQIVDHTNAWGPDVVAVTGDIVEYDSCLDWIDHSLARLAASAQRLFILGNHDTLCEFAETRRRLEQHGFVNAGGRVVELPLAGGRCIVAGNETPWFPPAPDVSHLAPRDASTDELRLALLHTPDHFAWTQEHGFHVALAGHNHGGQVRFPILGALLTPSIYGTRYTQGVFSDHGTVMHVSPGTSSLSPIRWGCRPELNLLTLRRA
ncbi:metallophosphoesterase [Aeoliella sp.]|uniref:metallophosphoesterase n=1 Tax=Aeoliella sp. TaxID=2795800 RepID=UPI003CCB77E5